MEMSGKEKADNMLSFGLMEGVILFIGLFVCIYVSCRKLNTDIFFIINNGRYIVENKGFFPTTLFSTIHEDFYTIIQQPLWSTVLYLLFRNLGIASLPVFFSVFPFISLFLLLKIFKYGSPFKRACLSSFILILICLAFTGRPSSFSVTNILFNFYILEGIKDKVLSERKALFLLPSLLLELLCHASFFPILIFIQLSYMAGLHLKDRVLRFKYVLISIFLSVVFGVCSPYGIKLPLYSFYSYGSASYGNLIAELKRPSILSTYTLVIIIAALLILWQLINRHADGVLLTFFGICALLLHVRNLYLLGVLLVPLLRSLSAYDTEDVKGSRLTIRFFVPIAVTIFYAFYVSTFFIRYAVADGPLTPASACSYILENDRSSRVYSDFNMGAYLEFCGMDSYIDARPELYFKKINGKEDVYLEFVELSLLDNFDYNGFIDKYRFEYMITADSTKLKMFLDYRKGYEKILEGNGYSLYRVDRYGD